MSGRIGHTNICQATQMNAAITSIVLLLAIHATTAHAAGEIVAGTYVRAGSNNKTSATLKILQASAKQATISLEVIAKPSASATTARTGRLNRELLQVSSQTAVYRDTASGTGGCSIKFAFGQNIVRVKQTGQCDEFGVGIDATGRYILRKAMSVAPRNPMVTEPEVSPQ